MFTRTSELSSTDDQLSSLRKALTLLWKRSRFDQAETLEAYLELVSERIWRLTGVKIEATVKAVHQALVKLEIL